MARGGNGSVQVSVSADVSDVRVGMAAAGGYVREFTKESSRAASTINAVSGAFEALSGTGGAAGQALGAVSGVLVGLATGGAIGAVMAGIGGIVSILRDLKKKDVTEGVDKLKTEADALAKKWDAARLALARFKAEAAGGKAGGEAFDVAQDRDSAARARDKAKADRDKLLAEINAHDAANAAYQGAAALPAAEAQRRVISEKLAAAELALAQAEEGLRAVVTAGGVKVANTRAEEEKKGSGKADIPSGIAGVRGRTMEDVRREAEIEAAKFSRDDGAKAQRGIAPALDGVQPGFGGGDASLEALDKQAQKSIEIQDRLAKIKQQNAEEEQQQAVETAATYASAIGETMAAAITGQKTLGQAMAGMLNMVLSQALKVVTAQITADALAGGAAAFKSQAGVPLIGPMLGLAAMTAAISTVMGLLSSLPGRATGGPVGMGSAYVVGERGPEVFVPGQDGTIVPNGAGAGGGNTTIIVQPLDTRGFEDFLERNADATIRRLTQWKRDRRMG